MTETAHELDNNSHQMKALDTHADATAALPPLRRRALRPGVLILAVVAVVGIIGQWLVSRWSHVYVADARIGASVIAVSSETAGRVVAAPIMVGDRVSKGELLVSVDNRKSKLQLREINAEITRVKSERNQLRTQQSMIRRQVESRLASARAQVKAAEADHAATRATLETKQADLRRMKSLREQGAVSAHEFDEQQLQFLSAKQRERAAAAQLESTRAALASTEAGAVEIEVLDRQIDVLDAEGAALLARRGQQRVDLDDRNVRAAFDGVVDAAFVNTGEYVFPGRRLLMYHDPSRVWVDANVKETEFRRLKVGAPATIKVDAYPDREFKGEVIRLGQAATSEFALLPSPNPSGNFTKVTQRLPIRVAIKEQSGLLHPGMMVELEVDVVN